MSEVLDDCLCDLIHGVTLEQVALDHGMEPKNMREKLLRRYPMAFKEIMARRTVMTRGEVVRQWLDSHRALFLKLILEHPSVKKVTSALKHEGLHTTEEFVRLWWNQQPERQQHLHHQRQEAAKKSNTNKGNNFATVPWKQKDLGRTNHARLQPYRTYKEMGKKERESILARAKEIFANGTGGRVIEPLNEEEA